MRSVADGRRTLIEALRAEGGTLAELTAAPASETVPGSATAAPGPVQRAAAGPRARGHEAGYELLLEMILEGVLLHYGAPVVAGRAPAVHPGDPDLALLLGDHLYAMGLSRLAALGDLEAVTELGDTISLIAQAAAGSDRDRLTAIWAAGSAAIGWGSDPRYQQAKARARAESPAAAAELRLAAVRLSDPSSAPSARR